MQSRVRFLGHPIHQMLVTIPVGLLLASVVFDLIAVMMELPAMAIVSFWMLTAGLVGGLVAAPFGLIDWLAIPVGTRARRIGALHGGGNFLVLALFGVSWAQRSAEGALPSEAVVLSVAAAAVAAVTAWLCGELVSRLGVGVYDGAGLDAPSSLDPTVPIVEPHAAGARDASRPGVRSTRR